MKKRKEQYSNIVLYVMHMITWYIDLLERIEFSFMLWILILIIYICKAPCPVTMDRSTASAPEITPASLHSEKMLS